MTTAQPSRTRTLPPSRALVFLCLLAFPAPHLLAQRVSIATRASHALAQDRAFDAGQLPVSEPLALTLRLQLAPVQTAALDNLLAAQIDPTSPSFHHWLTPAQFADQFGASAERIATLTAYLESQGLTVASVSPTRTRLTVTGAAGQVERALSVSLHRFTIDGAPYFSNTAEPTLPPEIGRLVAGISGLDDLPPASTRRILLGLPSSRPVPPFAPSASTSTEVPDALASIAEAIDRDLSPVLTLTSAACSTDLAEPEIDSYRDLFRQASAQGITVLATSSCATPGISSFPASLGHVSALTVSPGETSVASTGVDPRPSWQAAAGLPADTLRHEPDLTTTSLAAFAQTITTLNQQTGGRLGNVNATLYALAKSPGLYTQPDISPASPSTGEWKPATGLGLINLDQLLKVYPRTSGISTKTSLVSDNYAVNYGTPFTLTSNVQVTGVIPPATATNPAPPAPTGTITFTASTQGILGTSSIDGSGSATLPSGVLPVGTYALTASYSGDAYYAPSSSTSNVTITVSIVNARLVATLAPTTNVPYGATATVTATVTLPGSSAAPSGPVSAQIEGITGALFTATLSPNPGANSATANIVLSIPSPGSYTVQVSCAGSTNFQCQTPVNIPITTVKGYTNTTISVTPAAPQAGQPISLTATVVNSGNGTGTYTYGGSISFYDSGKLIATAPVATNQATTTTTLSGTRAHTITAVYTGDSNWNTSTSTPVAVYPTILPDELTISTNVNGPSSLSGINIIFTGSVSTTITYQSGPTGTVTFFDTFNNSVVQLGNPSALVANGPYASIGIFTTTGLQPGVHRIYAQYSGDDDYAPSISPVITLSLSDFNVTMNPATLTLSQGKSAEVNALVGASGGFAGTVSLGCTPPGSSEATCNISPSSIAIGQSATITFSTTAARSHHPAHPQLHSDIHTPHGNVGGWSCATGVTLATLFFFAAPRRRRPLPSLLLVLLAVTLTANLGCGLGITTENTSGDGGTGSNPSDPGTPLGTQNYVITAAGSDGVNTVRHTYQYQVTVQ